MSSATPAFPSRGRRASSTAGSRPTRTGQRDGTRDGFAIEDAETGAFLGIAGLVAIERDANQAEIGYVVVREARGRGIATRALRLVTDYALGEVGLERVAAHDQHRQRAVDSASPNGAATTARACSGRST